MAARTAGVDVSAEGRDPTVHDGAEHPSARFSYAQIASSPSPMPVGISVYDSQPS